MARDGSTEAEATARIEAQMPLAEKMRRADLILDNDGASGARTTGISCHAHYPTLKHQENALYLARLLSLSASVCWLL